MLNLKLPGRLVEVLEPSQYIGLDESALRRDCLIVVITKDNPSRATRTLSRLSSTPFQVLLIDDSTTDETKSLFRVKFSQKPFRYHGRREQQELIGRVLSKEVLSFAPKLGTKGRTLGLARNYATLLAKYEGYRYLLMIDDDIVTRSWLIPRTFGLLRRFCFVGAKTIGMADDSVVGHLFRKVGVKQYDYITAQYLGIDLGCVHYYFPNVYNEDLLFLAFEGMRTKFARCGSVSQEYSSPFTDLTNRLPYQEFGETLLLGVSVCTVRRRMGSLLKSSFWEGVIASRTRQLDSLMSLAKSRRKKPFDLALISEIRQIDGQFKPGEFTRFCSVYLKGIPKWQSLLRDPRRP